MSTIFSSALSLAILVGYETKVLSDVQPEVCQQQYSYDIDHMDAPT